MRASRSGEKPAPIGSGVVMLCARPLADSTSAIRATLRKCANLAIKTPSAPRGRPGRSGAKLVPRSTSDSSGRAGCSYRVLTLVVAVDPGEKSLRVGVHDLLPARLGAAGRPVEDGSERLDGEIRHRPERAGNAVGDEDRKSVV